MTKDHILEIRNFYMKLLDSPNLKDSIFHQAHCEEMVALCNYATRPEGGWHKPGEYEYVVPAKSLSLEAGERAYVYYRPTGRWFIVLPDSGLGMNSGPLTKEK